jgi:hypothetical protein
MVSSAFWVKAELAESFIAGLNQLQKRNRVNNFERAKALAKLFGCVGVAGHQVEQILVAGDDVIRAGGNGQVDVGFVVRVAEMSKTLGTERKTRLWRAKSSR